MVEQPSANGTSGVARFGQALKPRLKRVAGQALPPVVWTAAEAARRWNLARHAGDGPAGPDGQDLDVYWDPSFAAFLEVWGEGNVWVEAPLLLWHCPGRILDIACGTGRTMQLLHEGLPHLDLYGCDISDALIDKAAERGIARDHLEVCDATATTYEDDFFAASYSIGSLEHFANDGIVAFIRECHRITKGSAFHQIPVSKSGREEGWIKHARQSFYNNPVEWWMERFTSVYPTVHVLDSVWQSHASLGKWFVCVK